MRLIKRVLDKVTYNNVGRITTLPFFLGAFLVAIGVLIYLTWLALLGGAMTIASLVLSVWKWRCPHCGSRLDRTWEVPKYCSHCGKELDKK